MPVQPPPPPRFVVDPDTNIRTMNPEYLKYREDPSSYVPPPSSSKMDDESADGKKSKKAKKGGKGAAAVEIAGAEGRTRCSASSQYQKFDSDQTNDKKADACCRCVVQ